jgi:hypothetical protein
MRVLSDLTGQIRALSDLASQIHVLSNLTSQIRVLSHLVGQIGVLNELACQIRVLSERAIQIRVLSDLASQIRVLSDLGSQILLSEVVMGTFHPVLGFRLFRGYFSGRSMKGVEVVSTPFLRHREKYFLKKLKARDRLNVPVSVGVAVVLTGTQILVFILFFWSQDGARPS